MQLISLNIFNGKIGQSIFAFTSNFFDLNWLEMHQATPQIFLIYNQRLFVQIWLIFAKKLHILSEKNYDEMM